VGSVLIDSTAAGATALLFAPVSSSTKLYGSSVFSSLYTGPPGLQRKEMNPTTNVTEMSHLFIPVFDGIML
jgi:hypothetical protein